MYPPFSSKASNIFLEYKVILDEKEKQVASMLQEREMDRDEIVRISAQVLELTNQLEEINETLKKSQENEKFLAAELAAVKSGEPKNRRDETEDDDLEDFGDSGGSEYLLGEIEDLKSGSSKTEIVIFRKSLIANFDFKAC